MTRSVARRSTPRWIIAASAILLVVVTGGVWLDQNLSQRSSADHVVVEQRPQRRDFSLVDATGQKVTLTTYQGKWSLLFFGFTMCPDACPLAMQKISAMRAEMGESGKSIQPVFITIDPERDTPAVLKEYLTNFDEDIAGLSGTAEETAAVAKLYGVYYRKRRMDNDYTMDHSTALYLVAPDGSYVRPYRSDVEPDELAENISAEMKAWKN